MYDSGVKCLKKGEQRFGMKSEVAVRPSVVGDGFVQLANKFVKDASQFHNLCVTFHKFHALFSARLLWLG